MATLAIAIIQDSPFLISLRGGTTKQSHILQILFPPLFGIFIPNFHLCFVDKKEQIIKAAMKLLTERGVQATPMSAIAKAANTGMGTIYNYFATKEELINAIYLYIKRSEVPLIAKTIDPDSSLKASFFSFYGAMVGFYFKYPESFAFMDQFHSSPIITEATRTAGQQDFLPVISLVQQGQKDGIIKEMELDALLHFLAGTITTYVRWMQSSGKENDPAYLERQMRLVWDAIKE